MALTDSVTHKKYKRTELKTHRQAKADNGGGWWADQQKRELVNSFLITGNLALSARICNIPEITARKWKATQWWKELEQEFKTQEKMELNGRLKSIIEKTLSVVEDRIENGDYQYDPKTGQTIRRPVNVRDANNVANTLLTKQEQINNRKETQLVTQDNLEMRLIKLAERFAELAQKKKEAERTVDVTDVVEVKEN